MEKIRIGIIGWVLFFSLNVFGVHSVNIKNELTSQEDSLVVFSDETEEKIVVSPDQLVKVYLRNEVSIRGKFVSLKRDTLTLLDGKVFKRTLVKKIKKIKVYHSADQRFFGGFLGIVGGVFMIFGILSTMIGGMILKLEFDLFLSKFMLKLGLLLLGASCMLIKFSMKFEGQMLNLKKKWRILVQKSKGY